MRKVALPALSRDFEDGQKQWHGLSTKVTLIGRCSEQVTRPSAQRQQITEPDDDLPSDPVNVPVLLQVTANSGHMRESARSEVDDAVASRLRFILAAACMSHDPVELGIRGWSLAEREEPGCLSVRVFGPLGMATSGRRGHVVRSGRLSGHGAAECAPASIPPGSSRRCYRPYWRIRRLSPGRPTSSDAPPGLGWKSRTTRRAAAWRNRPLKTSLWLTHGCSAAVAARPPESSSPLQVG